MSTISRKIILGLSTSGKDAVAADLDEVRKDLDELKKTVTADVRADAEQAKRDIAEVKGELDSIPKSKTIRIRVEAAQADLKSLEQRLASLSSIKNDLEAAGQDTSAVDQRMGSLATRIENVRTRVQGLSSDFDKLGSHGDNVTTSLVSHIPLVGELLAKISTAVGQFASNLLPAVAQGFTGIVSSAASLVVVGPIILVIAAALSSLLVTIGLIIAAVAALAVAFLVALAPIGILLALVGSQIMKVISGTNALKQAVAGVKSAYDTLKQSVANLHNAQQNEARQRIAALADEKSATLALADAEDAEKAALLGVTSAKLAAKQARLTLAQFNQQLAGFGLTPASLTKKAAGVDVTTGGQKQTGADPLGYKSLLLQYQQDVLAIKTADLGVSQATHAAADSAQTLALAHAKVDLYLKEQLDAYPAYNQAIATTASAVTAWKVAEQGLLKAQLARDQASKGISGNAETFLGVWDKLKKTLSAIFGPAEKVVFGDLDKALTILAGHGKSLAPAFKTLGGAIGQAFINFAKWMTQKSTMSDFKKIIGDAASLTKAMAPLVNTLLSLFLLIAKDALPSMVQWIKHAGQNLANIVKHPKAIAHFIHLALHDLSDFGHAISGFLGMITTLSNLWKGIKNIIDGIGNALGVGGKGILIAVAALYGANKIGALGLLKGLGGGLGGAVTGGAGGLGVGAAIVGAGAAGYLGGSLLYKHSGAVRSAGGAVASGVDSLLGVNSVNPADYAGKEGFTSIIAAIEKSLQTGLEQFGTHAGQVLSAAQITQFLAILHKEGVNYTGPVVAAPSPATAGTVHHHNWTLQHGNTIQSDQHFAGAIERRLAAGGGGYK